MATVHHRFTEVCSILEHAGGAPPDVRTHNWLLSSYRRRALEIFIMTIDIYNWLCLLTDSCSISESYATSSIIFPQPSDVTANIPSVPACTVQCRYPGSSRTAASAFQS